MLSTFNHFVRYLFITLIVFLATLLRSIIKPKSVLSHPMGLGKSEELSIASADLSAFQYLLSLDSMSIAAYKIVVQALPMAPSLLFCLSLQIGISPEQDALYVLVFALATKAFTILASPEAKHVAGIFTATAGLGVVSSLCIRSLLSFYSKDRHVAAFLDGAPRPMFFPVQTSHTRLFPKVHSLSYPFMWTGIPIGFRGNIGGVLSCERKIERFRPAWFTVDACDYMSRGTDYNGLDGKLGAFLISQGANPEHYPYAYLLTVSKFAGHAFNPVSFWYLYSTTRCLVAVIAEVNNTFGERHLYFLKQSTSSPATNESSRFTSSFGKDFFVSPFSDRSGSYSLITNDPLFPDMTGNGPIKLCLTLSSDSGRPKVVARVYSRDEPIDPAQLSWLKVQRFALNQAWNTWATEPRTVYQAVLLKLKRGLEIFTIPEPLRNSLSRVAKGHEVVIEEVFRRYLEKIVKNATGAVVVRYTPAGIAGTTSEAIRSPVAELATTEATAQVIIRVLTPLFYARMTRYHTVAEALNEEARQGQTLEVACLDDFLRAESEFRLMGPEYDWDEKAMMGAVSLLRRTPRALNTSSAIEGVSSSHDERPSIGSRERPKDNKMANNDSKDNIACLLLDREERRPYTRAVLKLLLSDWLAFGNLDLLAMERFIARAGLMWMACNWLQNVLHGLLS